MCLSFEQDAPGVLYEALGEFAQRGINLVKIESRPTKQSLGQYLFLIDCDGHQTDSVVREAIEAIRGENRSVKVLGSYPRWQEPS